MKSLILYVFHILLRDDICHAYHTYLGHQGRKRTLSMIKRRFFSPVLHISSSNAYRDVVLHKKKNIPCEKCTVCGKIPISEVGIKPGPHDLKATTLPRHCKSWLLPQGSRSVLYTYPDFTCIKHCIV